MNKIFLLKTASMALASGMILALSPLRADITFTGSGASATLVGESQTFIGTTNLEGEINFITGMPATWYYDSGSEIRYGEWSGEAIWGVKNYYFDGEEDFNYSLSSASGLWGTYVSAAFPSISNFYSLSWTGTKVGESGVSNPSYRIGEYAPLKYSQGIRETHSGSLYRDAIFSTMLLNTATYPEEAHFIEATVDTSASSLAFRDSYFTWYRAANLPTGTWGQKTSRDFRINSIAGRSVLAMSFGGSSNILKLQHPTNSAASMGIELNPSSGTIKINNVALLTETTAANTYLTPSAANSAYVRLDDTSVSLGGGTPSSSGNSFAVGPTSVASASSSMAMGSNVFAVAQGSVAIGSDNYAGGQYSVALGSSGAYGDYSIALGGGLSEGDYSTAAGAACAGGDFSTAFGGAAANAVLSTAFGGFEVVATSFGSTVLGLANVPGSSQSATTWQATDELFVVGNGSGTFDGTSSTWTPSNGLVMRKNANMRTGGTLEAKGVIRCAPGGDLSMGSFTAGQNPATLNAALKYSGE